VTDLLKAEKFSLNASPLSIGAISPDSIAL
jgi:hypothetical protein